MNELFNTTSARDGLFLSVRILERVTALDALCVCVTFLDELASLNEKVVSMVATVVPDDPATRTYKVVRRPADGRASRACPCSEVRPYLRPAERGVRRMRAQLMFADRDFEVAREDGPYEQGLIQDLELTTLWKAMARGDEVIWKSSRTALLASLESTKEIHYRQAVYLDCLANRSVVEELYELAGAAIAEKKKSWRGFGINSNNGEPLLHASIKELESFVGILKRLHQLAEEHADAFESEGFTSFFATLRRELDDAYFGEIGHHLRNLRFRDGVLASARLGTGNQGVDYALSSTSQPRQLPATPDHEGSDLQPHDSPRGRRRPPSPEWLAQPRGQPRSQRPGAVGRPHRELLHGPPQRAWLLPRVLQPA